MTTNPRLRSPVPRPFFTGNYVPPTADIVSDALKIEKTIDEKLFYRTLDFSKPEDVQKASTFLGTKNIHEVAKKNSIFKEKIEFYSLKEGDYFGARGLLEGHTDNDENKGQGYETIVAEPAKFSVIAESRDVKVFILRKKHFALLTENTMVTLT